MKNRFIDWFKQNRLEFFFLIAILLLASFFRLYRIVDYMTFLGDEGRDVLVVKRMMIDHKWTLLGPTASVGGFFLGPIYYYFMIPFLWVFRLDPVGPAVMAALFGIATVFLVYYVGKKFFDIKVGLLAAGLYTISPLVIAYSRSSWNPNLVPFFALFYVYSLYKILEKTPARCPEDIRLSSVEALVERLLGGGMNKRVGHDRVWRWWLFSGFLLGIGLQLHYLFTFLIVMGVAFLIITRHWFSYLKYWMTKLLGLAVGWSPFIAFELRHRFPNTRSLYQFIFHGQETGFSGGKSLGGIIFRLFGRLVFHFPPPEQYYRYRQNLLFSWKLLIVFTVISSLAILIVQAIKKKETRHLLVIFWLIFGVGLFLFYQKEVYDYYLGIMFPLPFLLTALALTQIAKINKVCCYIAILLYCYIVVLNLQGVPFRYTPNRQLAQTKKIAKVIFEKSEGKPMNFALITGQNSDHAYRYFLEIWGNPPKVIENLQVDPERKSVADQLFVVCEVAEFDCHPLGHSLWEIAGFGRAEIVNNWPAPGGITVMKLVHYTGE